MASLAGLIAGNSAAVTGVAGVAVVGVVGVGLVVSGVFAPEKSQEDLPQPAALVAAVEPVQPEIEKIKPQAEVAEIAPPRFDVVRIEPDGTTLIAGNGTADNSIEILMDGKGISKVVVDPKGWFVSYLNIAPSNKPRVLTLTMRDHETGEVLASDQTVIIAATEAVVEPVVVGAVEVASKMAVAIESGPVEPDEASGKKVTQVAKPLNVPIAAKVEQVAAALPLEVVEPPVFKAENKPVVEAEPVEIATVKMPPELAPVVQTVLLADNNGVRVLQAPKLSDVAPSVMSTVALDTITYSTKGDVQIAGRSTNGGFVRVYLNNRPITTSRISQNGSWKTELPNIVTGIYTLRVDEVDAAGVVTSRVVTPFKREEPSVVAAAQAISDPINATVNAVNAVVSVRVVTVQPGSTLWEIARSTYGDGNQYVRVFQANKDRIRNADLIYPGQVFNVPSDVVLR